MSADHRLEPGGSAAWSADDKNDFSPIHSGIILTVVQLFILYKVQLSAESTVTIQVRQNAEVVMSFKKFVCALGNPRHISVVIVIHNDEAIENNVLAAKLKVKIGLFCRVASVDMNKTEL